MKKIVRKLQKAKVPASDIKEMDLSKWEDDRTARGEPTQSANIDDRRKEKSIPDAGEGQRMQQSVLDKDNESEPKSDSSNITSKNITSRENPNPQPLKPMSDFISRSINSPIRSERSMPGPYQKRLERVVAARRARGLDEEAPANATGAAIPGTGDDPQAFPRGEPLRRYKKKTKKEQEATSGDIAMLRRATPMMENTGTFAGSTTFIVPSNVFQEARMQKKSGKHWRTYIGEEDHWRPIREYANKNPKRAIVLQCEKTGAMCYARYGGKHDNKRDS